MTRSASERLDEMMRAQSLTEAQLDALLKWYGEAGELYGSEEHDQFVVALLENFHALVAQSKKALTLRQDFERTMRALVVIAQDRIPGAKVPKVVKAFAGNALVRDDSQYSLWKPGTTLPEHECPVLAEARLVNIDQGSDETMMLAHREGDDWFSFELGNKVEVSRWMEVPP